MLGKCENINKPKIVYDKNKKFFLLQVSIVVSNGEIIIKQTIHSAYHFHQQPTTVYNKFKKRELWRKNFIVLQIVPS